MLATLVALVVHPEQNDKCDYVAQCLIHLCRVLCRDALNWHTWIQASELKSPGYIGYATHNLRVAEVAETHQRTTDGYWNHNSVQPPDVWHLNLAAGDPHTQQHTQCRAVACHSSVAELGNYRPGLCDVVWEFVE